MCLLMVEIIIDVCLFRVCFGCFVGKVICCSFKMWKYYVGLVDIFFCVFFWFDSIFFGDKWIIVDFYVS